MENHFFTVECVEPMIAASFYAFGTEPEKLALDKLGKWAVPKGYFDKSDDHPVFGFNNPEPQLLYGKKVYNTESKKQNLPYGYEILIGIDSSVAIEEEMRLTQITGGYYAVLNNCTYKSEDKEWLNNYWKMLFDWVRNKKLKYSYHQALEKYTIDENGNKLITDLYYPIVKP